MTKHHSFAFLGNLISTLMSSDRLFTYHFFKSELSMSEKTLSAMKRGDDMHVSQYLRLVGCVGEIIDLHTETEVLQKGLRAVITSHCDLLIATVPHKAGAHYQPKEWFIVIHWEDGSL